MTGAVDVGDALLVEAAGVVAGGADVVAVGCVCAGWYTGDTV